MDIKANKITKVIGRGSAIDINKIGGTEEIARFMVNTESAEVLKEESINFSELIKLIECSNNKLILLGSSKYFLIKISIISLLKSNIARIEFIKTSNKTNFKDLIIKFLLLYIFKKIHVTDLDGAYFSEFKKARYNTINISTLINSNLKIKSRLNNNEFEVSLNQRDIDIAYIGRVDDEKGFYNAVDILKHKTLSSYKKKLDLLLWDFENESMSVKGILEQSNIKNLSFTFKVKNSNSSPNYNNIKAVLLPYKNFNSTIRMPLVIFEALRSRCLVFLPIWIKLDSNFISVIDNFLDLNNITNSLFFYESSVEEAVKYLDRELKNINQENS